MRCPKCNGSGKVASDDPCEAQFQNRHESIRCWYDYQHDGTPHAAMLYTPCAACGGYDEHAANCADINATGVNLDWYGWSEGDAALTSLAVAPPWEEPVAAGVTGGGHGD